MLVGVDRCALLLSSEAAGREDKVARSFVPAVAYGLSPLQQAFFDRWRIAAGEVPVFEHVGLVKSPLIIQDPGSDPRLPAYFTSDLGFESLLILPLLAGGDMLGVMLVEESHVSARFHQRRLELFTGIAQQAALAIQNDRLQREMDERERLERELQLAREIQETFMPSQLPFLPGWELSVTWRAARQVAGDFYDFFELPGRRLGLVIADVADKGIPAALFMALTRALVRAAALEDVSPAVVLARVNDLLVSDAQQGMFVTAVYAVLSLETGQLVYANAGHHLPLLLRSHTGDLERLEGAGIALGVIEGIEQAERDITLEPGDYLILYTDGITEAFSPEGEIYSEERLWATIQTTCSDGAQAMMKAIDDSVIAFVGDSPPSDDVTLMVVRRGV
jgi:serine phosphatase RsbU (regulator of sigma subunit)